jgi:RNA polymerase-associated protein
VLAEKGILSNIVEVDRYGFDKTVLKAVNPDEKIPTLVDRELVLDHPRVIMEYLDERFPHPSLLPVYPTHRAKSRLIIHRIENDWYAYVKGILQGTKAAITKFQKKLAQSLLEIVPLFKEYPFCLSDDFSLIDCSIAPILWRLPLLDIDLPKKKAKPLLEYADKIFGRPSFRKSLTETEQEIHLLDAI